MKLIDLKPVIYSTTGDIQTCVVYDRGNNVDLEYGCSVEYAYKHYGDMEIQRVFQTYENGNAQLIFCVV